MHGHLNVILVVNILFNSNITSENTKFLTFHKVALDSDIVHALTVSKIALVRSFSRQLRAQIVILNFFSLLYTVTNICTINSQIITLLHVSTLSCRPQGTCNKYLAKVNPVFKMELLVIQFKIKMLLYYQQLHLKCLCNLARY